jgi:hypothetical protein
MHNDAADNDDRLLARPTGLIKKSYPHEVISIDRGAKEALPMTKTTLSGRVR